MFLGYIALDDGLRLQHLSVNDSELPSASTTTPAYRIYGQSGLLANGTGTLSAAETGVVTGATNATPIVITSANHGLTTGQRVTVASVGGNTAANGTWTITRVDADTFSLDTSVGNGAYTTGGTWTTTGLYAATITPTDAAGYAQGEYYDVLVYTTVGGGVRAKQYRFGVV